MKKIDKKKLDNMETKWTTFPSDTVFSIAMNIKTRMVSVVWNNEEPLEEFSITK